MKGFALALLLLPVVSAINKPKGSAAVSPRASSKKEALKLSGGSLWSDYQSSLKTKPIVTKACTSCVGFAISDTLTQLFIEKGAFNLKRLAKMASFGLLCHGTSGHYFYNFLDKVLAGTTPAIVALKVAVDQTLWAPLFMVMFFSYMCLFDGTPELIASKIKGDIFTAVKGSWMTWIPAHTINFAFVPSDNRLLYINTIQIFFNIFMSVLGNKKVEV